MKEMSQAEPDGGLLIENLLFLRRIAHFSYQSRYIGILNLWLEQVLESA